MEESVHLGGEHIRIFEGSEVTATGPVRPLGDLVAPLDPGAWREGLLSVAPQNRGWNFDPLSGASRKGVRADPKYRRTEDPMVFVNQ